MNARIERTSEVERKTQAHTNVLVRTTHVDAEGEKAHANVQMKYDFGHLFLLLSLFTPSLPPY